MEAERSLACALPVPLIFSRTYLLNASELPEVFASENGCQDDCGVKGRSGGTGVGSRGAPQQSSL